MPEFGHSGLTGAHGQMLGMHARVQQLSNTGLECHCYFTPATPRLFSAVVQTQQGGGTIQMAKMEVDD